MKTKTLPARKATKLEKNILASCPNFHRSGSITGMKRMYYGAQAKLIRSGAWIYNATGIPRAETLYNYLP